MAEFCEACRAGDGKRVRKLLEADADVNAGNPKFYDEPPLHYAVLGANLPIVQLLLEKGADVLAQSRFDHRQALHYAARSGSFEIVQLLLSHGADPAAKDQNGCSAYYLAFEAGHHKLARALLATEEENTQATAPPPQGGLLRAAAVGVALLLVLQLQPFQDALALLWLAFSKIRVWLELN
eukprot:g1030.t1